MLSVVTVGFKLEELPTKYPIMFAQHDPSLALGLSSREYMLMVQRVVEQADVLVVNLGVKTLSPDEVVVLHTAYTKSTPILGVGHKTWTPLIEEMISQRFLDIELVADHIVANYKVSKK